MRPALKKSVVVILALAMLGTSLSPAFSPQETYAQFGGVSENDIIEVGEKGVAACAAVAGLVYGFQQLLAVLGFSVPVGDTGLQFKDLFLDCMVYQVINVIIDQITDSIITWIQGGFDGNPVFVTNLNTFYRNIVDNTVGEFVGTDLEFLCSPFKAQIQLALINNYRRPEQFKCSLSDVIDNVDDFVNGDFAQGSWAGWFQLTQIPKNNPYGAYVEAEQELNSRITAAVGTRREELQAGRGFLSWKTQDCYSVVPDPNNPGATTTVPIPDAGSPAPGSIERFCDPSKTATPGSVIEEQVNFSLGSGTRRIEMADEINEILNALIAYFLNDVLTGDKGLAGYNRNDFTHEFPDIEIPDIPGGGGPTTPSDDQPPGPPGPSTCFAANGTFFNPSEGATSNEWGRASLPLPANVSYDRIEVDLDVTPGGWHPSVNSARYNIFWLARGGNRDLYGYTITHAPSSNATRLVHGVGQMHTAKPKVESRTPLQVGTTYHFNYVYDAAGENIQLTVTESDTGRRVLGLTSTPDVPGINVGRKRFIMDFSFPSDGPNPVEVPSYGWEYKDLRVSFVSIGDTPSSCKSVSLFEPETPGDPDEFPGGGNIPPRDELP
ncbi:hypothetical protein L0Y40_00120 [Candidatus Wolfebacteria bacterium]|nr:hypothetical protein [Candidatus Wolfebacteria bacterium]